MYVRVERASKLLGFLLLSLAWILGVEDVQAQSCSPGWSAFGGTCYIFLKPSPRVTWPQAVQICTAFNSHVVNIASAEENAFVAGLVDRDPWIGINDRDTEGVFRWQDRPDEVPPYLNFATLVGVPDNLPPGEDCGVMFNPAIPILGGQWNDEKCDTALKDVVCEQGDSNSIATTAPPPTTPPHLGPCPLGWTVYETTCFKYFDSSPKVTWTDARQACIAEGGHLADIRSAEENFAVQVLLLSDSWIGYNDINSEGNFMWDFTGDSGPYTNWNMLGGEPNDLAPGEDCVVMYENVPGPGQWNDDKCELVLRDYVCEQGLVTGRRVVPDVACPPGWTAFNSSCYIFLDDPITSPEAEQSCRQSGGFLASIHSEQENLFVHSLITADSWIGYDDTKVEGAFVWLQGGPATYTNWISGAPDDLFPGQDCTIIYEGTPGPATWNDQACSESRPYVCETARVFVHCNSTHMGFHVARGLLRPSVQPEFLHLNDATCRVQSDEDLYFRTWRLDECGNTINYTVGVEYTQIINNVQHTPTADGISRSRSNEVKVICLLLNLGNSSTGPLSPQALELNTSTAVIPVLGFGDLAAHLALTDAGFATPVTVFPHAVTLNDELFFRILVLATFSDLDVFARRCYGTASADPSSLPQHTLIDDHCPVDNTVVLRPASVNLFRFSVRAFEFVNQVPQVFIHCEFQVCPVNVPGSRCSQGCQGAGPSGRRRRRQAESGEYAHGAFPADVVISQGPFIRVSSGAHSSSSTCLSLMLAFGAALWLWISGGA